MLVITNEKIQVCEHIDYDEIYSNQCLIIFHELCCYVCIIKDLEITKTYVHLDKLKISLSKIQSKIYTNGHQLWDGYLNTGKLTQFNSIEKYRQWIHQHSEKIKVFNFSKFDVFDNLELKSKSQFVNIELIHQWFFNNRNKLLLFERKQYHIYNLFHIALYGLSNVEEMKDFPSQYLKLDLSDNRCKTISKSFNYLSLSLNEKKDIKFSCDNNKYLYKIDYSSSFIQLFCLLLDIKIEGDMYQFLKKEMKFPQQLERQKVKSQIFKIAFSQKIKKFIHIQFFNKMYLFSIFLQENYNSNKYIEAFISGKRISNNQKMSRSKILNYFLMTLQTQLYIGFLYQMLQLDKTKVSPRVFIHDAIIFEIDIQYYLQNIDLFQKNILTINNNLYIKRFLGKNLHNMVKI